MLAYIVTLDSGRRYTIRATEVRATREGTLELLADSPASGPSAGRQVVALFNRQDVVSVTATEFLVSEEQGEATSREATPHYAGDDAIPF